MTPRVGLAVAGVAALLLAAVHRGLGTDALLAVGAATLVQSVRQPGSAAPAALLGTVALSWLVSGSEAGALRLVGLAVALGAVHSCAALAAVTPPSARVDPGVLARWLGRTAGTTAAGLAVVAATTTLPAGPAPVWTTSAALLLLGATLGTTWWWARRG